MKKVIAILAAVLLIVVSSVTAFAEVSPTAPVKYKVEVEAKTGGTASSNTQVIQIGDQVILIASPDSDYEFTGWVIDGKYEIISGDLNSPYLVIKGESDIKAIASFKTDSSSSSSSTPSASSGSGTSSAVVQGKVNNSDTSPKTGSETVVFIGIAACLLIPVALIAKKKLSAKD